MRRRGREEKEKGRSGKDDDDDNNNKKKKNNKEMSTDMAKITYFWNASDVLYMCFCICMTCSTSYSHFD
jgi:hypothetical protein